MRVVPILDLPHRRARALLQSGAPVWVPVNPVEYHGPHLSLHNDQLVSYGLLRECHHRLLSTGRDWPLLVVHDLEIGVDPVPGPGSRHTPVRHVRARAIEAARALVEMGARSIVFLTFHGSPRHAAALQAAVRWCEAVRVPALAPLNLLLAEMLVARGEDHAPAFGHIHDLEERRIVMGELAGDTHAGFFETSLALATAPHAVDDTYAVLPPCPPYVPDRAVSALGRLAGAFGATQLSLELALAARHLAWSRMRPFPGYTGSPHHANVNSGHYFLSRIADRFAARTMDVLEGRAPAPLPILRWISPFV